MRKPDNKGTRSAFRTKFNIYDAAFLMGFPVNYLAVDWFLYGGTC